jgi:diguanylate cyclase (GGDEF)-like protein
MQNPDQIGQPLAPLDNGQDSGDARARRLAWLDAIVGGLPVGVTVEAENGEVVFVNDEAAARLGISTPAPEMPVGGHQTSAGAAMPDSTSPRTDIVRLADDTALMRSRKSAHILGETFTVSTFVDITERMKAETELARRAYFDELTGLPNRTLIREHVEAILQARPQERFALAFIDVDNFKHINDFYSHSIGDALLVKFAQRITAKLRPTDLLARISGDEFVLVLAPVESRAWLEQAVDFILAQIKQPFFIDGFEVFTSASIGVSVYPDHGGDYEALRRSADAAMYRVKNDAKGGAAFFDLAIGRSVTARMELEQRLRLAIRDRRFCCAFQPKVDTQR